MRATNYLIKAQIKICHQDATKQISWTSVLVLQGNKRHYLEPEKLYTVLSYNIWNDYMHSLGVKICSQISFHSQN
jgi:hypothetical protein